MKTVGVILIIFLVLSSCATRIPNIHLVRSKQHTEPVYIDEENRLYYFGSLKKENNQQLFSLYKKAAKKPKTLVIFSTGGDVYLGMELGNFVFDNHLDVEVNRMCGSSCANYIFTAAQNKYLNPDSILFWHGSSWQPDINEAFENHEDWAVKWRKTEIEFFHKIGVDYRITIDGIGKYKWRNYIKALLTRMPIMGFNYSIEDMKKFGVNNVYLTGKEWNWKDANKCCHILRVIASSLSENRKSTAEKLDLVLFSSDFR